MSAENRGEFIVYRTEDGRAEIKVRLEDETVWLTQRLMAALFQVGVNTINHHLKEIYSDGELSPEATIRNYRIVQTEGGRKVSRDVDHYNLEAIIAVGYRVRSSRGTQFRRWATERLSEYLVKGFVMDDERLKNPGGWDYFDELLARIREIRASEKRFYQKVRDLFALSCDYRSDDRDAQLFFAETQNKLLFAVTGKTAAEIVVSRADPNAPNMALTNWSGSRVRKHDVVVAKNYLSADEVDTRELLNYRDAFAFVSEYLNDGGPVTEGLIREIHMRLVEGVRGGTAQPGAYRVIQNRVVNSATGETVYTPPPPGDVPDLMRDLVKWLNAPGDIHPVLVSGIAQFQLVHIHPFVDGNGRTSRLLSTLCLYRTGYDFKHLFSISEFYDRNRPAFYAAIQGVRDNGMDLTGWLDYFTTGLATQMDEIKERGTKVIKASLIAREYGLNKRQQELLIYCMEVEQPTITRMEKAFPDFTRRTLQRDLNKLVEAGILLIVGHTNDRYYTLPDNVL